MGSICLSSASILRCASFSRLENFLVIIPTVLQFIFSSSLLLVNWNNGRRFLLLTAEGWIYLILSGIELFSEVVPAARNNLSLFRGFDLGLGVASFLPIFFYTFFLFLFTSGELLETLPIRLKNITKLTLILFVPAIIIFNEVASFVGVMIRTIPPPHHKNTMRPPIAAGFTSNRDESLWVFFTSLTLALLTAFQFTISNLSFFRLVRAILRQREIENQGSEKAYFINGTAWIAVATHFGFVETVIGFAGGGFGVTLTRKTVRMLSRACLCVGVVKGVDGSEEFRSSAPESAQSDSENGFRQLISNPRVSTLRELSPTASSFHATPRAPSNSKPAFKEKAEPTNDDKNVLKRKNPHYLTTTQRQSMMVTQSGLPGMNEFASIKEKKSKERVTVHHGDGVPKLHLRFSTFDPTNQVLFAESVKSRPQSELIESYSKRTYPATFGPNFGVEELTPPVAYFQKPNSDPSIERSSLNTSTSTHEIVDARKLPQTTAMGQVYDSTALNAQTTTPQLAFLPASYQPRDIEVPRIDGAGNAHDSIQAVRELTTQFPGPPDLSKARFIYTGPEVSLWEEDSVRLSAQQSPASATHQALGSPSDFLRKDPAQAPPRDIPDNATSRNSEFSSLVFAPPSPVRVGKAANRVRRDQVPDSEKSIYPFSEDEDGLRTPPATKTPTNASAAYVHSPLRQSMKPYTTVPETGNTLILDGFELVSPSTNFSQFGPLSKRSTMNSDTVLDLGMVMGTSKSRPFTIRTAQAPLSSSRFIPTTPTTPHKFSKTNEKLERIADWVEAVDTSMGEQPKRQDNTLQNLHDRGESIDNLAMPWPKTKRAGTSPSLTQKPTIPRLKSVGKAPWKATPAPITGHRRKSVSLEPIAIPPRPGDMPEVIQIDYGSLEPRVVGGVLGDSEVLWMEDNMNGRRPRQVGKPS